MLPDMWTYLLRGHESYYFVFVLKPFSVLFTLLVSKCLYWSHFVLGLSVSVSVSVFRLHWAHSMGS